MCPTVGLATPAGASWSQLAAADTEKQQQDDEEYYKDVLAAMQAAGSPEPTERDKQLLEKQCKAKRRKAAAGPAEGEHLHG